MFTSIHEAFIIGSFISNTLTTKEFFDINSSRNAILFVWFDILLGLDCMSWEVLELVEENRQCWLSVSC